MRPLPIPDAPFSEITRELERIAAEQAGCVSALERHLCGVGPAGSALRDIADRSITQARVTALFAEQACRTMKALEPYESEIRALVDEAHAAEALQLIRVVK